MDAINKLLTKESTSMAFITAIRSIHPLFQRFTFQGAGMIFGKGQLLKFKASQIIFEEGTKGESVFLILYGKVIVRTAEKSVLGIFVPGETIGEEALFNCLIRYKGIIIEMKLA